MGGPAWAPCGARKGGAPSFSGPRRAWRSPAGEVRGNIGVPLEGASGDSRKGRWGAGIYSI
eukprot:9378930-Pyramimonas_sp.AAC.1